MTRLRYNGLSGTLGAALTTSATAVTFGAALTHSGGTPVPTLSGGDYIPLALLDSNGRLNEVVWLTAYTSGATTGTITRGQEGTTGVAHSSGDKFVHGPTISDLVAQTAFTSACEIYLATGNSLAAASGNRTVTYDTLGANNDAATFTPDAAAGTITINVEGWYFVESHVRNDGTTGEFSTMLKINRGGVDNPPEIGSPNGTLSVGATAYDAGSSGFFYLKVGDVIRQNVFTGNSVAVKSSSNDHRTFLRAARLGIPASGTLLGIKDATASATYTINSSSDADLDAVNLAVTFIAPASGRVLVELEGYTDWNQATGALMWTVREGTTTVKTLSILAAARLETDSRKVIISGLVPGSLHTYKFGAYAVGGGTGHVYTGGAAGTFGNAMISVWAA